jgi:hypothetical protein
MQVVETFLWQQQRLRLPSFGQSNVPADTVVDHPGAHLMNRAAAKLSKLHNASRAQALPVQGLPERLAWPRLQVCGRTPGTLTCTRC